MAILDIVLEGDPRLRHKATRIRVVDDALRRLAADMHETMIDAQGVGLAGPQIGVGRRLIVVHLPENYADEGGPETTLTLVNPEIVKSRGRQVGPEGCLSIPGWVGEVPRADWISVKAVGLDNKRVAFKAEGILARVLQHEVDHLDGILYVDRIEDPSKLVPVPEDEEVEGPVPDVPAVHEEAVGEPVAGRA